MFLLINPPSTVIDLDAVRARLLEATWIGIPFLLSLGMFMWGASVYFRLFDMPEGAMEVHVVGKQWMWKFQHPDGRREINELHVPLGTPVRLNMISQDVIHSMYVPGFRVKHDVLPGRFTSLWFEGTRLGAFHMFCAEYCGTQHSLMKGRVVVLEPAEYQAWLAGANPGRSRRGPVRGIALRDVSSLDRKRALQAHALPHEGDYGGGAVPHPSPRLYVIVWGMLMLLLGLTVAVSEIDLGQLNFFVAFAIAMVKAVLIVLFFTHVRYSFGLTRVVACAGFFWLAIMLGLTFADYMTRGWLGPDNFGAPSAWQAASAGVRSMFSVGASAPQARSEPKNGPDPDQRPN